MQRRGHRSLLITALAASGCSFIIDREIDDDGTIGDSGELATVTSSNEACGDAPPPGPECPPGCDSCDGGACLVECSDGCEGACAPDRPCLVMCSGEQSCKDEVIHCPADASCEVSCQGKDACEHAKVICGAGPCAASCDGAKRPAVDCGPSCECSPC